MLRLEGPPPGDAAAQGQAAAEPQAAAQTGADAAAAAPAAGQPVAAAEAPAAAPNPAVGGKSTDGGDTDSMDASVPGTPAGDADAEWAAGKSDAEEDDEATLDEEEASVLDRQSEQSRRCS